jgi:peptidoglycan biosynthesis protein MviN/MurJ (putative lipid II flippase)
LLLGLAANVLVNLLLLPAYGLHGCVVAAACGACVCLIAVLACNRRHGMATDRGVWLAALAPAALGWGPWAALAACGLIAVTCLRSELMLTNEEREQLTKLARDLLGRIMPLVRRRAAAGS